MNQVQEHQENIKDTIQKLQDYGVEKREFVAVNCDMQMNLQHDYENLTAPAARRLNRMGPVDKKTQYWRNQSHMKETRRKAG